MKHKPDWTTRFMGWLFVTLTGIIVSGLLLAVGCAICQARDNGQYSNVDPAIKKWVEGLKNENGEGCCATADGYPAEVEWDTDKSHYRVRINGEWYVIPDKAVLKEPNKLGYAVVWFYPEWEGGKMIPKIRCFLPGAGG